jgi:hypothetical protein
MDAHASSVSGSAPDLESWLAEVRQGIEKLLQQLEGGPDLLSHTLRGLLTSVQTGPNLQEPRFRSRGERFETLPDSSGLETQRISQEQRTQTPSALAEDCVQPTPCDLEQPPKGRTFKVGQGLHSSSIASSAKQLFERGALLQSLAERLAHLTLSICAAPKDCDLSRVVEADQWLEPARAKKKVGVVLLAGGTVGPAFVGLMLKTLAAQAAWDTQSGRSVAAVDVCETAAVPAVFYEDERIVLELVGISFGPTHWQPIATVHDINKLWHEGAEFTYTSARDTGDEHTTSLWAALRSMLASTAATGRLSSSGPAYVRPAVGAAQVPCLDGVVVVDTSQAAHAGALLALVRQFYPKVRIVSANAVCFAAPHEEQTADETGMGLLEHINRLYPDQDPQVTNLNRQFAVQASGFLLRHPAVHSNAAIGADIPLLAFLKYLSKMKPNLVCFEAVMSPGIGHVLERMERGLSFSAAVRESRSAGHLETWDCREELSGILCATRAMVCARALGFTDLNLVRDARVCIQPLYDESRQSMTGCDLDCVEHRLRDSPFVGCRSLFEQEPATFLPPPGHAETYPTDATNVSSFHRFMTSRNFMDSPDGISSLDSLYESLFEQARTNETVLQFLVRFTGTHDPKETNAHGLECPDNHLIRFVNVFQEAPQTSGREAQSSESQSVVIRGPTNASMQVGLAQVDRKLSWLGEGAVSDFRIVVKWKQNGQWHRTCFRGEALSSIEIAQLVLADVVQAAELFQ